MTKIPASEESLINSIVGEGTHFKGNLELSGLLRIDGDYSGSIHTTGKVIVGTNGRTDCTINAGTVVIGGVLRGAVYATEKVIILSSALVIGIVHAPRLIAEEGVLLDGEFRIYGTAEEVVTARNRSSVVESDAEDRSRGFLGLRKPKSKPGLNGRPAAATEGEKGNAGYARPSYSSPGRG